MSRPVHDDELFQRRPLAVESPSRSHRGRRDGGKKPSRYRPSLSFWAGTITNTDLADFSRIFARLSKAQQDEETRAVGGVNIRMVRVTGGGAGRWDTHPLTAETVIVWSGDFTVEFRDHVPTLSAGQCCVVPRGVEHRGTSRQGAEVVLFQQAAA